MKDTRKQISEAISSLYLEDPTVNQFVNMYIRSEDMTYQKTLEAIIVCLVQDKKTLQDSVERLLSLQTNKILIEEPWMERLKS